MQPFARLAHAFSKNLDTYYAVALQYMYYNFCLIHKALRVTLEMETGIADHVFAIEEITALMRAELMMVEA